MKAAVPSSLRSTPHAVDRAMVTWRHRGLRTSVSTRVRRVSPSSLPPFHYDQIVTLVERDYQPMIVACRRLSSATIRLFLDL